jgi:hypothetical protein
MDQQRIEVIQVPPLLQEPGSEGTVLPVAVEEGFAQGAEQGAKGQFDFRISVVEGRIDQANSPPPATEDIPAPQG